MEITRLEKKEDVLKALMKYNDSAVRTIGDRVGSLELYAEKLLEYAENYIVLQDNDEIGFFSFYDNDIINRKAYLALIAIDRQYQRKGIGHRAIRFILKESRLKRMDRLRLEVDKTNDGAVCFYKKLGFVIVEEASDVSIFMEREV